ncbi:hypothetical protein V8C86DRAFT_1201601 [Haematococcus lacustris]
MGSEEPPLTQHLLRDSATSQEPKPKLQRQNCCLALYTQKARVKLEVLALHWALSDARTKWWTRAIVFVLVVYALSPLDFIQELSPVLTLMADLVVLPVLLCIIIRTIPAEIMADARQEASIRKLRLSGNWGLALCVYLVWLVQVVVGVRLISRHVAAPFLLGHQWEVIATAVASITVAFVLLAIWRLRVEARLDAAHQCTPQGSPNEETSVMVPDEETGLLEEPVTERCLSEVTEVTAAMEVGGPCGRSGQAAAEPWGQQQPAVPQRWEGKPGAGVKVQPSCQQQALGFGPGLAETDAVFSGLAVST